MLEAWKIAQRQMDGEWKSKNKIPSGNEDFDSSYWFLLGYESQDTDKTLQAGYLRTEWIVCLCVCICVYIYIYIYI